MPVRILVVDDDASIVRLLLAYLNREGYECETAADGGEAMNRFRLFRPDLVLLDVMMPGMNGWEVLSRIRAESRVPVIMLTSRDFIEDKVRGFSLGADDYVVKPFDPVEVVVRLQARLKTASPRMEDASGASAGISSGVVKGDAGTGDGLQPGREETERGVVMAGSLRADLNRFEVRLDGVPVSLKPKEIQLLYFLMRNRNLVFSRNQLLEKVWEYDFLVDTRTVDAHMRRLRSVLGAEGTGWALRTIWGVGYKFEVR